MGSNIPSPSIALQPEPVSSSLSTTLERHAPKMQPRLQTEPQTPSQFENPGVVGKGGSYVPWTVEIFVGYDKFPWMLTSTFVNTGNVRGLNMLY